MRLLADTRFSEAAKDVFHHLLHLSHCRSLEPEDRIRAARLAFHLARELEPSPFPSDWVMVAIAEAIDVPDGIPWLTRALATVSPDRIGLEARLLRGVEAAHNTGRHAVAIRLLHAGARLRMLDREFPAEVILTALEDKSAARNVPAFLCRFIRFHGTERDWLREVVAARPSLLESEAIPPEFAAPLLIGAPTVAGWRTLAKRLVGRDFPFVDRRLLETHGEQAIRALNEAVDQSDGQPDHATLAAWLMEFTQEE